MNVTDVAASQASIFSLLVPEMLLGLAACVLFLGSTYFSGRNRWGVFALLALGAAGIALAVTVDQIPTIEDRQAAEAKHEDALKAESAARAAGHHDLPGRAAVLLSTAEAVKAERLEVNTALFTHSVLHTRLATLVRWIALIGGAVLVLFSWHAVSDRWAADYHACLLLMIAGTGLTAMANDLITLFIALELISIPTYVILYLQRTDNAAQEAAIKYFLLSIFSSGLLLFGFSYLYGICGTLNIPAILDALRAKPLPLLVVVAVVMVVAGLGFRITAVPFHFYAPDVYQGSSPNTAGLLAFIPKVAGFVALLRVLGFVWAEAVVTPGLVLGLRVPTILFFIIAVITMSLGNVLALLQDNLKRLLAYSSVAHAGYMLIGLAAAPGLSIGRANPGGADAVLFYLAAYDAMTLGVFAVIIYLSTPERPVETVDDLAGLGSSHPLLALVMTLFLFSLIGMPLTAGFSGKFLLFLGALGVPSDSGLAVPDISKLQDYAKMLRGLALVGALNAAMAGWYYLRIVAAMYLRSPLKALNSPMSWPSLAAISICAIFTLGLGIYPRPLVELSRAAVIWERPAESRGP